MKNNTISALETYHPVNPAKKQKAPPPFFKATEAAAFPSATAKYDAATNRNPSSTVKNMMIYTRLVGSEAIRNVKTNTVHTRLLSVVLYILLILSTH